MGFFAPMPNLSPDSRSLQEQQQPQPSQPGIFSMTNGLVQGNQANDSHLQFNPSEQIDHSRSPPGDSRDSPSPSPSKYFISINSSKLCFCMKKSPV
jgi:hypothetical protein